MLLRNIVVIVALPIAITACGPSHPEIAMPSGHPANPASEKGRVLAPPAALRSELVAVTPRVPSGQSGPNPLRRDQKPDGGHSGHGG